MQDVMCPARGCRSHSSQPIDHVGVLELHVRAETSKPEFAGTTPEQLKGGCSSALSLKGILDNKSQITGPQSREMQFGQSDRFAVPPNDKRMVFVAIRQNFLQIFGGCRWYETEESP